MRHLLFYNGAIIIFKDAASSFACILKTLELVFVSQLPWRASDGAEIGDSLVM